MPLATSSTFQGTVLQLNQRTFTHNTTGVPIIVACTEEDPIDGLVVGNGVSGMGGMVKGKEIRTDRVVEILRKFA